MADPGHLNQRVTHLAGPELRALRLSTSASLSNSLLHVPSLPLQSWVPGLLYHLGQVPCLKRQHLALLLLPTPLSNPVLPITALPRVSLFLSLYSCQSVFDSVSRLLIPDLLFHSLRPDFHVSFLLCDCALRHSTSFSTYAVFHSWHSCLLCAIMSHFVLDGKEDLGLSFGEEERGREEDCSRDWHWLRDGELWALALLGESPAGWGDLDPPLCSVTSQPWFNTTLP